VNGKRRRPPIPSTGEVGETSLAEVFRGEEKKRFPPLGGRGKSVPPYPNPKKKKGGSVIKEGREKEFPMSGRTLTSPEVSEEDSVKKLLGRKGGE